MIEWMKRIFNKPTAAPVVATPVEHLRRRFTTDEIDFKGQQHKADELMQAMIDSGMKPLKAAIRPGMAMDGAFNPIKSAFYPQNAIPQAQMLWYAQQTFIGYQLCAVLSQQWLVSKCCLMPARDAVRNGYEVTVNDGSDVNPDMLDAIRKLDDAYKINLNMIEFIHMGRVFGIRIAMFMVKVDNPIDYYKNPFNPDGITPGSYVGISQIDPYWTTPELDNEAAGSPGSIDFYEPTWWRIGQYRVHRSHLVIFRTEEVPDILKPSYIYGGIPIPQKICERVFAAEKIANEAPMLALTKRTDVISTDLAQAVASQEGFDERAAEWIFRRDNYGIKMIDSESEKMEQFDTSLADLDEVIMTQYQLVAAAANVPAVKLLGTQPKGFNSTGEYEEASYHEELESIQRHDLTTLLNRHHMMLIRSEISPGNPFEVTVSWNSLDAMTAKELAELNKMKAETDQVLSNIGAIDGQDARNRVITDPESGYSGIEDDAPIPEQSEQEGA